MTKNLPVTKEAPVIRTDFSDDAAWSAIKVEVQEPVDGFYANVDFVDDQDLAGLTKEQLLELIPPTLPHSFLVVADKTAMGPGEHLLLVIDNKAEPGRAFRSEPSQIQGIENNLSIANMDFAEFADNCDPEGVFRGFPTF